MRVAFSSKRLKTVPLKDLLFMAIMLIAGILFVISSFLTQYETVENTSHIVGKVTNPRLIDTYSLRGSRVLLLFELNGKEHCIWYPNDGSRAYEQIKEFDFENTDAVAEVLISRQYGKRVVHFQCGESIFYSIDTENERIQLNKIGALLAGGCLTLVGIALACLLSISYSVISFKKK